MFGFVSIFCLVKLLTSDFGSIGNQCYNISIIMRILYTGNIGSGTQVS